MTVTAARKPGKNVSKATVVAVTDRVLWIREAGEYYYVLGNFRPADDTAYLIHFDRRLVQQQSQQPGINDRGISTVP